MGRKTLSTRIEEIEEKHDGLARNAKKCCMYKVHKQLRHVNAKAYKPTLLAIGPYNNQDQVGQGFMKEHKLLYLQQMLKRTNETVKTYMKELSKLEVPARNCYVECIPQTRNQFVEMMILDGCFIIELFRKYKSYKESKDDDVTISTDQHERKDPTYKDDPIFQMTWMVPRIARDLLLFENQLPFFVLAKLFGIMSKSNGSGNSGESGNLGECIVSMEDKDGTRADPIILEQISNLALVFFFDFLPFDWNVNASSYNSTKKMEDLLLRMRKAEFEHLLGLINATISISILDGVEFKRQYTLTEIEDWNIYSATELEDAGIIFKKAEKSNSFAIKFNKRLMEISPLSIEDDTETCLRNLIAYEQYRDIEEKGYNCVTDYVCFMDNLINSLKDVELLRRKGIIQNSLGDDEATSTMVNKLGRYIAFSVSKSIYANISVALNKHCEKRRYRWLATLKRDYFNNPWALFSFLAAALLLVLAIVQTVFSIIP